MGDGVNSVNFNITSRLESGLFRAKEGVFTFGNGEEVKSEMDDKAYNALCGLFEHIMKYSTEDSPEITPQEQWDMTEEIYSDLKSQWRYVNGGHAEGCLDSYNKVLTDNYDRFLEHYTNKNSPDGENMTVEELYLMSKKLINVLSDKKEE